MITTHELRICLRCPVDDAFDIYDVTVETTELVRVEDILLAVKHLPEKSFQEVITKELAAKLACRVKTVCYHSGVKTTCQA